jgi:hypothetical protein
MTDENRYLPPVVTLASLQASITVLSVSVGRLEERLHSMDKMLAHHTAEEHRAFTDALKTVEVIKTEVRELSDMVERGKGVRLAFGWIAAAVGALVGAVAWGVSQFYSMK